MGKEEPSFFFKQWLGFLMNYLSFSFDVIKKGHLLVYDKVLKITVSQLYKVKAITHLETKTHIISSLFDLV